MTGGVVVVVVVEVVVAAEIKNVLFVLPLKQIILKIIFYTKFKVNFLRLNSGELKSHIFFVFLSFLVKQNKIIMKKTVKNL